MLLFTQLLNRVYVYAKLGKFSMVPTNSSYGASLKGDLNEVINYILFNFYVLFGKC